MLYVKKQVRPGVVVLEVHENIQMGASLKRLEQHVDDAIQENSNYLILDLSRVTYIDSTGIGTIVRFLGKLKKLGGTLRLTGVKGMVEGVLKLTQVVKIIDIYPTAADACQDLPPVPNP